MVEVYDLVNGVEEDEQRKAFRRFVEDHSHLVGYWQVDDFNLSRGKFTSSALEAYFAGWCMFYYCRNNGGGSNSGRLGYVKTKLDNNGIPYVTSFSAIPMDDHVPVRLDS